MAVHNRLAMALQKADPSPRLLLGPAGDTVESLVRTKSLTWGVEFNSEEAFWPHAPLPTPFLFLLPGIGEPGYRLVWSNFSP